MGVGCWVLGDNDYLCWVLGDNVYLWTLSFCVCGVLYRRLTLSLQISGGPEKKLYQLADSFYCVIRKFNFPVTPIIYS